MNNEIVLIDTIGISGILKLMDTKEREDRRKVDVSVQAMHEFAKWFEEEL